VKKVENQRTEKLKREKVASVENFSDEIRIQYKYFISLQSDFFRCRKSKKSGITFFRNENDLQRVTFINY